jgi:hypothetical protein
MNITVYMIVVGLTLSTVIGIVAPIVCDLLGRQERRHRLRPREAISVNEWFGSDLDTHAHNRESLVRFLELVAKRLKVHWPQLRPDDTFSGSLNFAQPFRKLADDDYEDLDFMIEEWAFQHGVRHVEICARDDRLRAYVDALDAALQLRANEGQSDS